MKGIVTTIVLILVVILLLPLAPVIGLGSWLRGRWLRWRFHKTWGGRGKVMIFVYSDSPIWQEYVKEHLLPLVESHAVVLNWSKRSEWRQGKPVEVQAFRWFAGAREFNPAAIFIPRRGKIRVVRFYQAFRDYKHGKTHTLRAAEADLTEYLKNITQGA